ncbi:MAG: hypothetical protein JKY02_02850, partial [Flavobacteriaceae bacterium]|nr:hypothetical protein [Flavobacteriaceae bacterium]
MMEWFSELTTFEKFYWVVAGVSSIIFLFVLVTTFMGADTDDLGDVDAEVDADIGAGFQFFTFKNTVAFFTIFGWSGIASMGDGSPKTTVVTISLVCGLATMTLMAAMFYYISRLTSSGTLKMKNA